MTPSALAAKIREKLDSASNEWDCSWENKNCSVIRALRAEVDAHERTLSIYEDYTGPYFYAQLSLHRIAANLGISND